METPADQVRTRPGSDQISLLLYFSWNARPTTVQDGNGNGNNIQRSRSSGNRQEKGGTYCPFIPYRRINPRIRGVQVHTHCIITTTTWEQI